MDVDQTADVVVIGGGVIGCFIADELAGSGVRVSVVERGRVGAEASSASAGLLVPLHAAEEEGTRTPLFDLYLTSTRMFPKFIPELEQETGISTEYVPSGSLRLSMSEEEEDLLKEQFERWKANLGSEMEWIDRQQAHEMEPELGSEIRGGIFSKEEKYLNSARLVDALARRASLRGVKFLEGCMATGIQTSGNRVEAVLTSEGEVATRHVIVAAGAWSRFCCEWFGISIPIAPARGQMIAVKPLDRMLRRPIFTAHGAAFPRLDGSIYVGATVELVGFNKRNTPEGIASLLDQIPPILPRLSGEGFERAWAGLRPFCEDGVPVIGRLPGWEGVIVASGHFKMGIVGSPITARKVKEIIVDGREDPLIKPFSPARFADEFS
ncbi:MAG: glycine oxidase ThiO [Candidatus Latescibacteria bacterium]|nr:glycine oxidase ThiO [Candidatus Latescibacterota bacterium]